MSPSSTRIIYFSLDTDRLFTNFDPALHQEFISLGETRFDVGTANDPRQLEEENKELKEQVRSLSVFNSALISATSSLNERMDKMASTILIEEASSIPNEDTEGDPIEEGEEMKESEHATKIKFMGTNSRQTGSDV